MRKVVCSAARGQGKDLSAFERLWRDGKIELDCLPQGTFAEAIRAGGAGIPAFYTPVGFGTELTKGKEVRRFEDRDYVLEQAIKGDLALIRADTADRLRQPDLPLRADEFQPGHGHGRQAGGGGGARRDGGADPA